MIEHQIAEAQVRRYFDNGLPLEVHIERVNSVGDWELGVDLFWVNRKRQGSNYLYEPRHQRASVPILTSDRRTRPQAELYDEAAAELASRLSKALKKAQKAREWQHLLKHWVQLQEPS